MIYKHLTQYVIFTAEFFIKKLKKKLLFKGQMYFTVFILHLFKYIVFYFADYSVVKMQVHMFTY